MTKKTQWVKNIPTTPGWYWVRYRSKHGGFGISIAEVIPISGKPFVTVHRCGSFTELTRKWEKHHDTKFGPMIPAIPEAQEDIDASIYLDKRKTGRGK